MWTYSVFVDTQYVKNNSPVIDYVEDSELQTFLKIAQDVHLQRILGTNLFKDLQSKVSNNSFNNNEITLVNEYIQPVVSYCTVYEWILYNHYKFTNKGITKQNSDNSSSADLNEVNFVRDDYRNKMEYFKERLTKYLLANSSQFPLYWGGPIDVSTIVPKYDNYYSGIYTGRKKYGRNGPCSDCGDAETGPWTWRNLNW